MAVNSKDGASLRPPLVRPPAPVGADRITLDWRRAGLDERQSAICEYAEKITLHPTLTTQGDIEHLQSLGLSAEETWDVAEVAAMYNFTNRMAMATGQMPNRQYHAQHR